MDNALKEAFKAGFKKEASVKEAQFRRPSKLLSFFNKHVDDLPKRVYNAQALPTTAKGFTYDDFDDYMRYTGGPDKINRAGKFLDEAGFGGVRIDPKPNGGDHAILPKGWNRYFKNNNADVAPPKIEWAGKPGLLAHELGHIRQYELANLGQDQLSVADDVLKRMEPETHELTQRLSKSPYLGDPNIIREVQASNIGVGLARQSNSMDVDDDFMLDAFSGVPESATHQDYLPEGLNFHNLKKHLESFE